MYKFISSVRLAVILIAGLAGLAVSSTIYDKPEMFQSIPFRVMLICFFINLLTCSVGLWPKVIRTLRRKPEELIGTENGFTESRFDGVELEDALKALRFNIQRHETDKGTYLLARQKRLPLLAPHILHIGILIILVGAFLSGFATEGQLLLYPEQTQPLPTAISEKVGEGSITVDSFVTEYEEDGSIANWITTFDLTINGQVEAVDATTMVNHPYKKHGISIYQTAYQNDYVVHIESSDADVTGDYAIPEGQQFRLGEIAVVIQPMADDISLFYMLDGDGNVLSYEAFSVGTIITLEDGTTVEYLRPLSATVLQFKYSRATPIVFAGFAIAVIGSVLFLLGRYSEVRAFVTPEGRVSARVLNKSPYLRRRQERVFGISDEEEKA